MKFNMFSATAGFSCAIWLLLSAAASAGDGGFCNRLRLQTDAAKVGFKTIRGEFRAGRTTSGLLVTRTYSNVELWPDTACFFGFENGSLLHSCETLFDKDDSAARALRDNLADDLRACLGRDVKAAPLMADAAAHTANFTLTGNRAVLLTVAAHDKDGTDGRILISVRAPE